MSDAISAHGIGKRYGGVQALHAVSLSLRAGEVVALLGANGAGKSTLIGVLSGAVTPDEGRVEVAGHALSGGQVAAARQAGVSVVHQELMLFPDRSVVENVTATALPLRRTGLIDSRRQRAAAAATLARLGLVVPLDAPVGGLSLGQRQLVEIARALFAGGHVLILDEPTSALSLREAEALLSVIRSLAADGTAVLFVSHRLDEAASIADRIVVLRDGQVAGVWQRGTIDVAGIAQAMVGDVSAAGEIAQAPGSPSGAPVLEARELRGPGLGPVTLSVRAGEIVGFVGLEGSGIDTLLRGLGGAAPLQGEIALKGRPVRLRHPADALRAGLVYMPPDRKVEGLWLARSPVWNIATAPLRRCAAWRWPGAGRLGRLARARMAQVGVRLTAADAPVRRLSGGNQQRILFARSLEQGPAVLLLSDPTRGVDVRAKGEIHRLIESLAADGVAICVACSGIDEVLAIARRIICMRGGAVVAEGPRSDFDEARALALISSAEGPTASLPTA